MANLRALHPQERQLLLTCKASLRGMHEGPYSIPRKQVWMGLGIHDATYSRWLNPEEPDFPSIWDLVRIANLTGNPVVFRDLLARVGDGYVVEVAGAGGEPETLGPRLLSRVLEVDAALAVRLAQDLDDGVISPEEAQSGLPLAEARLHQAQGLVDLLRLHSKFARRNA